MTITFSPLSEAEAREVLGWRYPPPYNLYNSHSDKLDEDLASMLSPENAYYSLRAGSSELDRLIGFCCFGPDARVPGGDYSTVGLDIGLSIHPQLTGKGNGARYIEAVLAFAQQMFQPDTFRVTIAAFNRRAIQTWKKAGFRPIQHFTRDESGVEFVVMVREP